MTDANKLKQAQVVYKTMIEMFDARGISYNADEAKLAVYSGATGDDLPVPIRMSVDPERMLIISHSQMPFDVPENRRLEMAIAVSRANYGLPDGSFDYDFTTGDIVYRMTCCYRDSLIGRELFEYMFAVTFGIADEYNDLFARVAVTDITVDEIIKLIK